MISVDKEIIPSKVLFQKKYHLKKLYSNLGNIQNKFEVINVVGTNGKGSTSHFLFKNLNKKYKNVGLFYSPAFLYHNERIQVNGKCIDDDTLLKLINDNLEIIEKYKLTYFEIWQFIATLYFNMMNVEIAVIEAGIGGINDSTNFFENQIAVCLTSIGLDHTELLGNSVEEIIDQKIGISKNNNPIFISNDNLKYKDYIDSKNNNPKYYTDLYEDEIEYQKINKGLAKQVLEWLGIVPDLNISGPLGRCTILREKPLLVLDGCHNINGVEQLVNQYKNVKDCKILFAISYKKDYKGMLNKLKEISKDIYITDFEHPMSLKLDQIQENDFQKINNWKKFIEINFNNNIIICGSLYFIPQVYEYLVREK